MPTSQFTFDFILSKFRSLKSSLENIDEKIQEVDRKVTYVENVIRDHEEEDGCEQHND